MVITDTRYNNLNDPTCPTDANFYSSSTFTRTESNGYSDPLTEFKLLLFEWELKRLEHKRTISGHKKPIKVLRVQKYIKPRIKARNRLINKYHHFEDNYIKNK